ncbi:sulfatase-like hydrolase/transferase [Rhizobium oryziradicis]|uniref:Sulfatase n=1 Tax=Rhizobium oryziradicis TaxID=1867956 RepID=A0A1Q8ZWM0_9HYPH|nr:sulfatase-like hydrolase/transferase [Rhizobium oryziradicis]OLP46481.1 sulfatase [Rhizobium oryziradicis]
MRRYRFDKRILAAVVFFLIAFVVLTLPDHPDAFSARAFLRLPVEVPLLGLTLLLLPQRLTVLLKPIFVSAIGIMLFLKIADIGVQSAFQRPFNPYLDTKMLVDGWRLMRGTIGTPAAVLTIGALISAFSAVIYLFHWSATTLALRERASERRGAANRVQKIAKVYAGILLFGAAISAIGPMFGFQPVMDARALPYLSARLTLVAESVADMRRFERELAAYPSQAFHPGLFQAVRGRDVVLIFIESYGRSAVDDPRYRPLVRARQASMEHALKAAGYGSASGWSVSPTVGGISWLAHGTLLSGLWIDSQARYDRLMMSDWPSLNRQFQQAGWRTAAVMPAITMDWPEASYFGYDQVLASKDLGYKGKPFNWVTMPDQYTLHALDQLVRQPARRAAKPVMAEIALISSHAPWTPIPKLVDWDQIGDGTIFNAQAEEGDSPAVVWADQDRVRHQYIQTIDYTLQTVSDYITRFGDDAVFIILGDHQPAALITGSNASRSVPVHIISRDQKLIERFGAEGFSMGMTPQADAPEVRMGKLRPLLVRLFSTQ